MSKRDIIIFLFKWKATLIGYFLFIVALSTLIVYVVPQKYHATATLLVESNRAPVMRANVAYGTEQLSVLNSEIAIIRSNTVFESTADSISEIKSEQAILDDEDEPSGALVDFIGGIAQWMLDVGLREPMSDRERLIRSLQDGLKVEPQPQSNIIKISYTSDDPDMSARVVNIITDNAIRQHLKVFSSAGTSEIYRRQIDRLNTELDQLRNELAAYKGEKSVSALNETMQALVRQKTHLNNDLNAVKRELAELLTRFGKKHTKVVLAEEKLSVTKKLLDDITERLQNLEREETYIRDMETEIAAVEQSLQGYKNKYQDEQLFSLANTDVVNVLVVEKASPPSRPNHSRLFYIALASIGGMLVSLAIALISEYFDHRVTDPDVASELLGVPTLGSIGRANILLHRMG